MQITFHVVIPALSNERHDDQRHFDLLSSLNCFGFQVLLCLSPRNFNAPKARTFNLLTKPEEGPGRAGAAETVTVPVSDQRLAVCRRPR